MSTALKRCLDGVGAAWSNVLIGAAYALTSAGALAVLALYVALGNQDWLNVASLIFVSMAVIGHFLLGITAIALVDGYSYFPAKAGVPKVLLALTDVLQAAAFGGAVVSYTLRSDASVPLLIAAGIVLFTHLTQTYKAFVIAHQVAQKKRDRITGVLAEVLPECRAHL